ncbi:MAG: SDR family NAD(P)-dependent oxidoreductase, partial [Anaerolineae bacterium]
KLTISTLGFQQDHLHGETVIVTGAGGGIGYEAARALLWLGANIVIAEIAGNRSVTWRGHLQTTVGETRGRGGISVNC